MKENLPQKKKNDFIRNEGAGGHRGGYRRVSGSRAEILNILGRCWSVKSLRLVLAVLVCVLAVTWAVGPVKAAKTELTFWSWRTEDVDAYAKFIKAFESRNPDISVKFVPYKNTEYNTILATALQGGSGPDVIQLRSYGGMEALSSAGYLMPLDTKKVAALSKFAPDILKGATNRHDGKIYGVPFAVQTVQVLYNKAIFSKLGLSEPTTWDEFVKVANALKAKNYVPLANGGKEGWTLETLFGGVAPNYYGANTFAQDVMAGKTNFNDARFVGALRHMLKLRPFMPDNYMGVGYVDMQMMFATEMAAMMVAGSYELGTFANLNPNLQIGAFPFPGETAKSGGYVALYMDGSYGINASTKNGKAALKFINFLASQKFGQMFADELRQASAVPGVKPTHPVLAEMMTVAKKKSTPHLMVVGFRFEQPSGSTLLQNDLQAMFSEKMTAEQVAADIQSGLAKWYKPFQK